MITRQALRSYARAIWGAAQATGKTEAVYRDLQGIERLVREVDVWRTFIGRYDIPGEQRRLVLEKLFLPKKVERLTWEFLLLLEQRKMLAWLPCLIGLVTELYKISAGVVVANVQVAQNVDDKQRKVLDAKLRAKWGEKIEIRLSVQESLLAGFVIEVQGLVYDYSVAGRLERLRRRLISV